MSAHRNDSSHPRLLRGLAGAPSHAPAPYSVGFEFDLGKFGSAGRVPRNSPPASFFKAFSDHGDCLPTHECSRLRDLARHRRIDLYEAHIVGLGERVVARVRHSRTQRVYWADVRTGTLYRPDDGTCLSSTFLRMEVGR